jgi:short-subunit dehydrogenase
MTIKPGFVSTPMTAHLTQSFLFVHPRFIAKEIRRGIEQGIELMYIPSYWRFIMMIIRALPEFIFKKINI